MDESYTIQISSNLVSRLASNGHKLKKKTKKPKPKITEGSQLPNDRVPQMQPPISFHAPKDTTPNGGWPIQPPLFLPVPPSAPSINNPDVDAIRSVLQESESVLEKLKKREADMAQEVTQRAKELHEKEFKLPYRKSMPCLAEKDACFECYKEHGKDPLKCANVVNSFADCARKARQQAISSVDK